MPQISIKVLNIFKIQENEIKFSSIENNEFLFKGAVAPINKIDILFKD